MRGINVLLFVLIISGSVAGQQSSENPKPPVKNIILLIGDGMGVTQVSAAITVSKGNLNLLDFPVTGFSRTSSASDYITDSGAGATALSIGKKTYDHAIGMDADTVPQPTILEIAEHHNKATGMVVTSQVTHATPAAFIAHQKERYMYEEIAADFLNTDIDVFIGGGLDHFTKRKDGRDLIEALESKNYQMVYNMEDLGKINSGKIAGLLYEDKPPRVSKGRNDMLPEATEKAIEILNLTGEGFFLMVEGSQIDWGGHDNNTEYILEELIDFDIAVGKALEFARKDGNTLVIVTADHETGGMAITGGDEGKGEIKAKYVSLQHTAVMVPVFAYGPGAYMFSGIYENSDIFHKMMKACDFELNQEF